MLRIYALLIILLLLINCKTTKNISQNSYHIVSNKVISIDSSYNIFSALTEPSIVINKNNTNNIIAGSIYDNVYVSNNKGNTWYKSKIDSPYGVYGDPCLLSDYNGHIYYLHLSNPKTSYLIDRIVIQRSDNEGKTWTKGVGIGYNPPKQQDKHWMGINPETCSLAVTWTEFDKYDSKNPNDHSRILFSYSDDLGETWSKPVKISQFEGDCLDNDYTTEGAIPVFDKKGNIYIAWAYNEKIYFDKSTNNGKTWLKKDIIVANQPGGWAFDIPGLYRTNGLPVLAIDNSKGQYKGTLYINWADQRNGENNTDIFISKSTDQGNTWSKPKIVNIDNTKTHQFLTWLSVDPVTGYLYIIYYDRSKYKNNKTDVVLAVSKDGGESFVTKTISGRPFIPKKLAFFGDYNNIDAYNGIIIPVWTDMYNGKLSIKTTTIKDNN